MGGTNRASSHEVMKPNMVINEQTKSSKEYSISIAKDYLYSLKT